jgi:probable HAF family extracellular repeat protein
VDGVATPYFAPDGYLQFNADINSNPWWTLQAGLEGNVGVDVGILGDNLDDLGPYQVFNYPIATLAQANGGFSISSAAPTLGAITPNTASSGSPGITLALVGSNFVPDSVANFNGALLTTTFVDENDLTALLPAVDLLSAGVFPVTVSNPDTAGAISGSVNFTVAAVGGSNPVPSITSLSPSSLTVGATPQNLTINGTGFLSNSTVTFNGIAHTPAFVSASQLTISLTSADLATAGTFPVVVSNPSPGGGASNPVNFTVTSGSNQVTVASLSFNPTSITPGASTTGTVTLSAAAPTGGALVTLSSSYSSALPVPANVTVPAGSTTATFTATSSSSVNTSTQVTVMAAYNNSSQSATVTVSLLAVTVSPSSAAVPVSGTQQFTANVTGTSDTAVNWNVNNIAGGDSTVGTISSAGLYTAPGTVPNPATVTVTATSQATPSASASANVTITTLPYNFIALTYPGSSTFGGTWAYGINGGGEVVGLYGPDLSAESWDWGSGGFSYASGAYSVIEYPGTVDFQPCGTFAAEGAQATAAYDINDNSQIVGAYSDCSDSDVGNGFLYSGGVFSPINYPGATEGTYVSRINNNGEIVGSYTDSSGATHGFLYAGGSFSSIDYPGAASTAASCISESGQIVGSYTDSSGATHGFLYAGGSFSSIDYHGATSTAASCINDSGQIVGSYTDSSGATHGFLYAGGSFSSIDYHGATSTAASRINNSGQIVGSYTDSSGATHGFLYAGGTFSSIDYPGATGGFTSPSSINNSGQIVGTYAPLANDLGVNGFLATPQP